MKYLKSFEARTKIIRPKYYDFKPDIVYKHLLDADYWWEIISNTKYDDYSLEHLFKLACQYIPKLAVKMVDILSPEQIIKNDDNIYDLPLNELKSLLTKNDLYKRFDISKLVNINNNGDNDIEKIKLLRSLDPNITFSVKLLNSAIFYKNLKLFKYLISIGLDASETIESYHISRNSLGRLISNIHNLNKETFIEFLKYIVNDLNVAVTPKHIYEVVRNIDKVGDEALEILMNAKNTTDDYEYSGWSTYDKKPINKSNVVTALTSSNKIDNNLIKKYLSRFKDFGYGYLQSFSGISKFNQKDDETIDPKNLELVYWVISNYNGHENSFTTEYITNDNVDFWLKKMKENPSIINKLKELDPKIKHSYEYQKTLLEIDPLYSKTLRNIHPKIEKDFKHLFSANKYNIL
jgi:hypothetical protein